MNWLLHVLGVDDASGRWYLWWSGIGSDLAYLSIGWALVRRYNCHQPKCWRIGRFPVAGTSWSACRRHHPAPPQRGHRFYLGERPGRG